jgi:hypothetical protein
MDLCYHECIYTAIIVVGYSLVYTATKEPIHSICEMMEWSKPINPPSQAEAVDSLRKALYLMDQAASHANLLKNEWCRKIDFEPCSPKSCDEERKKFILHLLKVAADLSTTWNKAVSCATMMLWQAKSIVDTLLPNLSEKTRGRKALIAIKSWIEWLDPKWQQTSSHVGMVHHNNIAAAEQWEKAIAPSMFPRKFLDSREASDYVEKVCRAAGWEKIGYREHEEDFFLTYYWSLCRQPEGFNLEIFFPEEELRNEVLDLECSLSLSFHAETILPHEMSKQAVTELLQKRIFHVDEVIGEVVCFLDTKPIEQIMIWIDVQKMLKLVELEKLTSAWNQRMCAELEKWGSTWNQRISAVGNALREMMETLHLLSSILDQGNERQKWLTIRAEAEKMLPSWASYIYGINQLFHRTEEARTIWQTLFETNSFTEKELPDSWYAYASSIPEEEREAVEAILRIRYHIDWMFRNDKSNEGYQQNRFTQMIYDWMQWKAQLLEPETSSFSLLATPDSDVYHQNLFLDLVAHPTCNIKKEVLRWLRMKQPPVIDQKVVRALIFPEKWPDKEVSLLEKEKSLETLGNVKKLLSDWLQDMSITKAAIQEMLTPIGVLSLVSPSEARLKTDADKIYSTWCSYTQRIKGLVEKIANVEDHWQSLVSTETVSTTTLSLNEDSVKEKKTDTKSPAKIHANVRISLRPKHFFSRSLLNHLTNEEHQTIVATDSFIQEVREIFYSSFTGQYCDSIYTLDSTGQKKTTPHIRRRTRWLGYDWFQLKHQLQQLDASIHVNGMCTDEIEKMTEMR